MKTTDHFKKAIEKYLKQRADDDSLFASVFAKEGKNIDDCITYILNTVQKSGLNGFTDDEVYSMAIHYYQEEIIDVGKAIDATVVVNHHVELTEEEKAQAKEDALDQFRREMHSSMKKKTVEPKKEDKPVPVQQSLF